MAETTSPVIPKISFPVPAGATGTEFSTAADLLQRLDREASGLYLVGGKGMWHGGIHITDTTAPWCALTGNAPPELTYAPTPHKGEQHLRCMADGDIVAFRVCKEYPTIPWEKGTLYLSGSFVLVRHYVQPGTTAASGLTFYTLYMHLAPYSAYASQTGPRQRTTKGGVKFYLTKEDVASNKVAGKFSTGNVVTLCDETMVRRSDNHQFSQVKMQDGRLVWTVSDGGFLKMAESNGASPPPWWSQCSPAYPVTPSTAAVYKNKTALNYYRCSEDVTFETVVSGQNKKWGKPAGKLLPVNTQMTMETDNAAQTITRPDKRVFKLMTMTADVAGTPLKRGERVWVVADGGNLEAVAAQSGSSPKFDEVITGQTIPVQAGAALGHLGFFQIPTETGFRSRYMVHIECLTSDSKVASFLTNPEAAGRESPAFLKYPADAKLFSKDAKGAMAESTRKTKAPGILTLSNVPAVSADGIPTHYQIRPEGGFLAAASVEVLSQFDLGKLGFSIIKDDPESFQLLDAENQPQNVVKGIFEKLKAAAEDDPVFSNALASHKYKQLLDVIDQNHDGYYSVDEYRNAVHNPAYRDPLYQLIVQHPSEWYYEKTDAKWTKYLEKLEPDASKWKKYTEAFLDKMIWMKKVAGMGPAPWHMHPVMFMGNLKSLGCNCEQLYAGKFKVTKYGAQYGPVYWGEITLDSYTRWGNLISEGKITNDEKAILIAMSENEGKMDAIQSYDSEVITAGAMQKTVKDGAGLEGKGELSTQFAKFRDSYPELYERYAIHCGWSVEGSGISSVIYYSDNALTLGKKITSSELKNLVRQGCSQSSYRQAVHNKPLAALLKIISLPQYLDLQILDFAQRLHDAESQVVTTDNKQIKHFIKSNFGRAVILDHSVNRPGYVKPDFNKALENFNTHNPTVSLDPQSWGENYNEYEGKLLDEYKLTRRMTDSSTRFNSLKAKL